MSLLDIYYRIKPFVPRELQIGMRRAIAAKKRKQSEDVWPVDERASGITQAWEGWPEGKEFALALLHDVDSAAGVERTPYLMEGELRLGFRSSFNFVPERYRLPIELRKNLTAAGFEIGVHGLKHDGKLFRSREIFEERKRRINGYLEAWQAVGFSSPSMLRNRLWIAELNIEYSCSSFDTDPFEPQNDPARTVFPFRVQDTEGSRSYIELPYTLPQDHCLFIILGETGIEIWKQKLAWIAENGGMALLIAHPDYMDFEGQKNVSEQYPAIHYFNFLNFVKQEYADRFWQPLPRELARFWKQTVFPKMQE